MITVLCNEAMATLLAPIERSKALVGAGGGTYIAAVYDSAAILGVSEDRIDAADAWWREMGECNTRIKFDQAVIRDMGILLYLCRTYGISTERNLAVALHDMTYDAGMTEIELLNWLVENDDHAKAGRQVDTRG